MHLFPQTLHVTFTLLPFHSTTKTFTTKQRFRSLSEIENYRQSSVDNIRIPLFDKASANFCFEKSCEIFNKPFSLALTPTGDHSENAAPITPQYQQQKQQQKLLALQQRQQAQQQMRKNDTSSTDSKNFIGENLLDIENTLKALNLDFMNAFHELEKADSAETLFGEHSYPYEATAANNPKWRNSATALKLSKLSAHGNGAGPFSPLSTTAASNPHALFAADAVGLDLDMRSTTPDTGFASRETTTSSRRGSQKSSSYSPQEPSAARYSPRAGADLRYPSSGALSAYITEHCSGMQRLAAKSSSPTLPPATHLQARALNSAQQQLLQPDVAVHSSINSINSMPAKPLQHHGQSQQHYQKVSRFDAELAYANMMIHGQSTGRQRSMSFTEPYDLRSPDLLGPHGSAEFAIDIGGSAMPMPTGDGRLKARAASAYRPRSIKARNLRRLSYNPIVLDASSTSSDDASDSDSAFDRSCSGGGGSGGARSECDIRSGGGGGASAPGASKRGVARQHSASTRRRRNQYLSRKYSSSSSTGRQDGVVAPGGCAGDASGGQRGHSQLLYGSNASIKSAPLYNYVSERQLHRYLNQKFTGAGSLYDFLSERSSAAAAADAANPPAGALDDRGQAATSSLTAAAALFSEFDVSKLTGKSPTTQHFLNELFTGSAPTGLGSPETPPPSAASRSSCRSVAAAGDTSQSATKQAPAAGGAFQWPEAIHASTVMAGKRNKMPWRQRTTAELVAGQSYSSDSSSDTDTGLELSVLPGAPSASTVNHRLTMPPSPAP